MLAAIATAFAATATLASGAGAHAGVSRARVTKKKSRTAGAKRIFGDNSVEPGAISDPSGLARAFRFQSTVNGSATSIVVFVGAHNTARSFAVALYDTTRGRPGPRRAMAFRRAPRRGKWNVVAIPSTAVRAGHIYWIAFLPRGGHLALRGSTGGCRNESLGKRLSSLPVKWTKARHEAGCRVSVYARGRRPRGTSSAAPSNGPLANPGGPQPANALQPYFTSSTVNGNGACLAGCAIEGQHLKVTPGVWTNSPTSYSYQWQDCTTSAGSSSGVQISSVTGTGYAMTRPTTGSCSNATGVGATSSTYMVGSSDVGRALAVRVTASNASGSTSTTSSGPCDTGLMSNAMPALTQSSIGGPPASTYFDNGEPGCSPISAVVGTGQFGAGASGEHFCTNAPITCGFADIANTGPPAGTTLYDVPGMCTSPSGPGSGCGSTGSGWSYSGGAIHLTSGATLRDVVYNGQVLVGGLSNVTIEDNDLTDSGENNWIVTLAGNSNNIAVEDNDLSGLNDTTPGDGCDSAVYEEGGGSTNVTVANNNMWFCSATMNQISSGSWTIENNYIHDFAYAESNKGNHFDGIQFEGGGSATSPTAFANNTDLMDFYQTSPVILSNDNGLANTYRSITHNLLAGGDFCLYAAGTSTYPTTDSTFSNNVCSSVYIGANRTGSADEGGAFGPVTYYTSSTNTWSGNLWDDNGSSIAP